MIAEQNQFENGIRCFCRAIKKVNIIRVVYYIKIVIIIDDEQIVLFFLIVRKAENIRTIVTVRIIVLQGSHCFIISNMFSEQGGNTMSEIQFVDQDHKVSMKSLSRQFTNNGLKSMSQNNRSYKSVALC